MKPHVCPKCEGEAIRMSLCEPCKGAGIVWEPQEQVLAPNPYIGIVPQPYIIPSVTPGVWPPAITWGGSCDVTSYPPGATVTYTSDGPVTLSSIFTIQ